MPDIVFSASCGLSASRSAGRSRWRRRSSAPRSRSSTQPSSSSRSRRSSEDLGLGLTGQQWIVLSYSLALAALYLAAGAIGDRYGRREAFIAGALGFARRLRARRRRAHGRAPHRRADAPGHCGRLPDHELARAPAEPLRRRGRPGGRALDVLHRGRDDRRAARGRRARRVGLVALDLLPEPPARGRRRSCWRGSAPAGSEKPERVGRLDVPGAVLAASRSAP